MKTAVEWLEDHYELVLSGHVKMKDLIKQAKAMEKGQIVQAYNDTVLNLRTKDGEQYYNETYKNK